MKGADFERALAFVLGVEGGYTNNPSDHGGATNKGITQREYSEWLRVNHLPKRNIADILNADVREIYWSEYWLEGRCDRMPWPLCLAHFDACVNVGVGQAAKFLQRSMGCKDDGVIGPRTLGALKGAIKKEPPCVVAERLVEQREPFYRRLVENEVSQARFLSGWLSRWWFCEKRLRGRQKYGALADTSDPTIFAGCLKSLRKTVTYFSFIVTTMSRFTCMSEREMGRLFFSCKMRLCCASPKA